MSIFGKLIQATIDTITSPIDMLLDCTPGGGGYIDGNLSHTSEKIEEINQKLKDVYDELS